MRDDIPIALFRAEHRKPVAVARGEMIHAKSLQVTASGFFGTLFVQIQSHTLNLEIIIR